MVKKFRVCVSVDEETIQLVRRFLRNRMFRSRSHAFEESFRRYIDEVMGNDAS